MTIILGSSNMLYIAIYHRYSCWFFTPQSGRIPIHFREVFPMDKTNILVG
jgi:hypothetical protein